jgi:hypothetical protein
MISLNKITIEYKSTVLFGFTALILSFLTGFLAGIRWNIVVLRSFVLMVLFAVIGFGICVILKRFVPEVYGLLTSASTERTEGEPEREFASEEFADEGIADAGEMENMDTVDKMDAPPVEAVAGGAGHEFRELEKEGLAHFSTAPGGGSGVHTATGKLGKHILEKEKLAKYEPKIMAQAVRTMMGKDKE